MNDKELLKELGHELQEMRQDLGITQKELADGLGYSRENISALENGRRNSVTLFNKAFKYLHHVKGVNDYE